MGYLTNYDVQFIGIDEVSEATRFLDYLKGKDKEFDLYYMLTREYNSEDIIHMLSVEDTFYLYDYKWYDCFNELSEITKEFNIKVHLYGQGEDDEDYWEAKVEGGTAKRRYAERVFKDDWSTI